MIIALGHSGFERDKEIAAQCNDVDLVVGGHCEYIFTLEHIKIAFARILYFSVNIRLWRSFHYQVSMFLPFF